MSDKMKRAKVYEGKTNVAKSMKARETHPLEEAPNLQGGESGRRFCGG